MIGAVKPPVLRADLHVHSYHSGHARHLPFLRTRDCYSEPEAVYRTAKARGMDLVTITDHDSIAGCLEFLERHPGADDFFVSEEIECLFPGVPLKAHIAAYGIDERIHREIQPLRSNIDDVVACLRQHDVFFALNHLFFFFDGQMSLDRYLCATLPPFPAFETRNGAMLPAHNRLIEEVLPRGAAVVGGSDAHTLAFVGTTYTEAPGRTREEFLQSLRAGQTSVGGRHGSAVRVAREIYGVVFRYWASLFGLGRQELSWARRSLGLAFSAVSMPFEFIPALVAVIDKTGEKRRMAALRREWQQADAWREEQRRVWSARQTESLR
jgi:predicted metal-dependent phosphoesterase TrpH